jgi:GNAT superfamily N-acetyltransferase
MAMTDADMVEFRTATADDIPAVVALLTDNEIVPRDDARLLRPFLDASAAIEADDNQLLVVGWFGGRIVCCAQLSILTRLRDGGVTRAQIDGLRVHPDMRGRGIGNVLLWWVLERARERGCGIANLSTDRRSDAESFFTKHGFQTTHHGMSRQLD